MSVAGHADGVDPATMPFQRANERSAGRREAGKQGPKPAYTGGARIVEQAANGRGTVSQKQAVKLGGKLRRVIHEYVGRQQDRPSDQTQGLVASRAGEAVVFNQRLRAQGVHLGLQKREVRQ